MNKIIDAKSKLKNPDILSILSESIYMPNDEKLNHITNKYIINSRILAYAYKNNSQFNGIIILEHLKNNEFEILNIAVSKEYQNNGIGKSLIDYIINNLNPNALTAETDDDAINFYLKCGFKIIDIQERYPGVIRYTCTHFSNFLK